MTQVRKYGADKVKAFKCIENEVRHDSMDVLAVCIARCLVTSSHVSNDPN